MDYALSLLDQLQAGENLFWLGINAAPLPASSAAEIGISPEPGLFVYAVDSGSPADQTGIQEGDFVTSIEGVAVGADGTLEQYCNIMRSHGPDDVLDVQVIRNNARYVGQINGRALEGGESVVDNLGGGAGSTAGSGDAPAETYNYTVVESDTGRITLQLPDRWEVLSDETTLVAAENVDAWLESFGGSGEGSATIPGFFISVVDRDDTVTLDTALEVLNGLSVPDNCTFSEDDRDTYSDPIYEGYVDYLACDNSGVYVEMIVYDPSSPNYLVWIEAFVISDADIDMLGTALGTFIVSPP
jgi:serine protease Do